MRQPVLLFLLVLVQAGCTAQSARRNTIAQTETWTDIQYRQVIENLAMVANNPDVLPCYSVQDYGTTSIQDKVGISGNVNINPAHVAGTGFIDPTASRQISENWTLTQVTGPEKLRALRLAFQYAVFNNKDRLTIHDHDVTLDVFCYPRHGCCANCGGRPCADMCPDRRTPCTCVVSPTPAARCAAHRPGDPGYYFGVSPELNLIDPGWLHIGTKKDVPKCARFSACSCETYVWVNDEEMESLSRFTLVIQHIARQVVSLAYYPIPDNLLVNLARSATPSPTGTISAAIGGDVTAATPGGVAGHFTGQFTAQVTGPPSPSPTPVSSSPIPVIVNCDRLPDNTQFVAAQISLPINCYGNVVIQKNRLDSISQTDQKLKSALGAAVSKGP
jgi:hypothetical protein